MSGKKKPLDINGLEKKLKIFFSEEGELSLISFDNHMVENQVRLLVRLSVGLCQLTLHAKLYELIGSMLNEQKAQDLEIKLEIAA